ncbi:MAG: EscU/YscU/HrcU family type III secretion system export apparatus switch protein [Burkholderiaceae bacterium]
MSEKTEKPTRKKLRDARKKGEVAKSKEVISAVEFAAVLGAMIMTVEFAGDRIRALLDAVLTLLTVAHGPPDLVQLMQQAFRLLVLLCTPFIGIGLVLGILAGFLQVQGLFSSGPIVPKFERLNPVQGFRQLFSTNNLFNLLKLLAKTLLLGSIAWWLTYRLIGEALQAPYLQHGALAAFLLLPIRELLLYAALCYGLAAIVDFVHQRYEFLKKQRMSKQDIRRERKDTDGDPHMRGERRRQGRAMALEAPRQAVAGASVVVVNPTHFAVALFYEKGVTDLPVILAKGVDDAARRIRESASDAGVPIYEDPPLARRLYAEGAVDEFIPSELFEAVAETLRWARAMRRDF